MTEPTGTMELQIQSRALPIFALCLYHSTYLQDASEANLKNDTGPIGGEYLSSAL